jgi:CBS domain-containing protein
MTRVRDIMTRDVIAIGPDVSIRDAMALLSSRHISGAPVITGRQDRGSHHVHGLDGFRGGTAWRAGRRERGRRCSRIIPRLTDELAREIEPLGSFFNDLWEDAGEDVDVRFEEVTGPERNVLDVHTVEEAMTRAPIFEVPGETSLPATAEFMRRHSIHRVMVTDRGAFVGIVTRTDLSNAVADHKLREHEYVFGKLPPTESSQAAAS